VTLEKSGAFNLSFAQSETRASSRRLATYLSNNDIPRPRDNLARSTMIPRKISAGIINRIVNATSQ
jgi:hypothetical protein